MNDVAVREPNAVAVQQAPADMLSLIAQAAANPNVDVAKMQALLDMKLQIDVRDAEVAFKAAMAALQAELPQLQKDGRIEYGGQIKSKYTKLESIDRAIRPLLAKHGFSLEFDAVSDDKRGMVISCTISHSQGHSKTSSIPLGVQTLPKEQAESPKNYGSTVSYGRRYLVCMMLNIITVDEDTDGTMTETPITDEQAMTIETMLADSGGDRAKVTANFCGAYRVNNIKDIPARLYQDAVNKINERNAKLRGGR